MLDLSLIFDGSVATTGTGVPTGQAITATAASTNVIDFLANRDVGAGDDLEAHVLVTEAFATLTSLQIAYQTSADNATFVNVMLSPVIPVASLVVGALLFRYKVPVFQLLDVLPPNRYHRLNYTVAGSNATAGKVFSFLTGGGDRQNFVPYGPNYTVGA